MFLHIILRNYSKNYYQICIIDFKGFMILYVRYPAYSQTFIYLSERNAIEF